MHTESQLPQLLASPVPEPVRSSSMADRSPRSSGGVALQGADKRQSDDPAAIHDAARAAAAKKRLLQGAEPGKAEQSPLRQTSGPELPPKPAPAVIVELASPPKSAAIRAAPKSEPKHAEPALGLDDSSSIDLMGDFAALLANPNARLEDIVGTLGEPAKPAKPAAQPVTSPLKLSDLTAPAETHGYPKLEKHPSTSSNISQGRFGRQASNPQGPASIQALRANRESVV